MGRIRVQGIAEQETLPVIVVGRNEFRPRFMDADLLDRIQHAEPLQDRNILRQKRFADVEPRVRRLFEQRHPAAPLRQQCRDGGAGRAAADYGDIVGG